ncbi:PKD domain-containing protein [Micromonospora sp. NPDC007208]|uniref:PKD domain-containing protein n=1 Tax=Micromonospora sp. NPDC007208 TaxID=3364236 RepID=UPI00369E0859
MRAPLLAGLATVVLTAGTFGTTVPAQADDLKILYVRQAATDCSDQNAGTLAQPFCSIGAAAAIVTGGQTVDIGAGSYRERVTVKAAGTPEQPVVFVGTSASLVGENAGFVIDGQHDIVLQNIQVIGSGDLPAVDAHDASGITIRGGRYSLNNSSATPVVRFATVTRSSLSQTSIVTAKAASSGVTMDAASSGVDISGTSVSGNVNRSLDVPSVGIRIDGPGNTVIGGSIGGFTETAVVLGTGATGKVVANNVITGGAGLGIHNNGATGTAITSNSIKQRCLDGIRVDGASSGVSIQNNVLVSNGFVGQVGCDPKALDGVEIGIYGDAVGRTVIDYNNVHHHRTDSYAWNTPMSLAGFRAASGQAANDRETERPQDTYDSANSAAPGFQKLDRTGTPRVDDPTVPNTGAGPVTYADRGAVETIRPPVASFDVALNLAAQRVTVDATASTPGLNPIKSYEFTFGDGSVVTQSGPVVAHTYANPGTYNLWIKVTATDGQSATSSEPVSVLRPTSTVGLLTVSNRRYIDSGNAITGLRANQLRLGATAQFDVLEVGNHQVALFSRSTARYLAIGTADPTAMTATSQSVDARATFTVASNTDGSISLKASTGQYVTADPSGTVPLTASRPTVDTWEKFRQVSTGDANRTLKARVNGRYVSADGAGTKPLIASAPTASTWERFDLVDLGYGTVALLAHVNNRFVSADGVGTKPLIASAPAIGSWEMFYLDNASGTVSFKAAINNKYASADGAGSKPLIANGPTISTWEKFTLG